MARQLTELPHGHVFVFGSNLAGRHGKGAAWDAVRFFGAIRGRGIGMQGQAYAIPTKDEHLEPLPLAAIARHVLVFLAFARENRHLSFEVTPIGCGLAGYTPGDIAPMFEGHGDNVLLPLEFVNVKATNHG